MKTVSELKQSTYLELDKVINQEVDNERKAREKELNLDYLLKHPGMHLVPERIQKSNKEFALYYTLGCLQALLRIAIINLQEVEAKLEKLEIYFHEIQSVE